MPSPCQEYTIRCGKLKQQLINDAILPLILKSLHGCVEELHDVEIILRVHPYGAIGESTCIEGPILKEM